MKASKIFKSFEALPQDKRAQRTNQAPQEPARGKPTESMKAQPASPPGDFPRATPRQWGINE
ncbi:MAG: hypothetical protein IH623_04720 [Verrucomicrobia bacterium]|nr:hypothetical protein [Verrucomicrobiota bacterium]